MNSVIEPSRVMRPITFAVGSTYQRFPSGPAAMSVGSPGVGTGNSVTTPAFVTRAIAPSPPACATHRFPSGPVTIPRGLPVGKPAVNSVMIAPGVIRPTPLLVSSVNQRLPSGPWAMPQRPMLGVRPVLNSEIEGPLAVATVAPAPRNAATNSDTMRVRRRTLAASTPPSGA